MRKLLVILMLVMPTLSFAETVKLLDGRTLKLNPDGTYEFLESVTQISLTAANCTNKGRIVEKKDDFNNVVGYRYFSGFSLQYKITNETEYPLVVRRIGTEFSNDTAWVVSFADPVEPGKSLIVDGSPHLFSTSSKNKFTQDEINMLYEKYGCSNDNLSGQKVYINTAKTELKLPPEAGNLDPLAILNASSEIDGLELIVR